MTEYSLFCRFSGVLCAFSDVLIACFLGLLLPAGAFPTSETLLLFCRAHDDFGGRPTETDVRLAG